MGWRGGSVLFLLIVVVLGSGTVAHDMDLSSNYHENYTQFLLANGVAHTPPMGCV